MTEETTVVTTVTVPETFTTTVQPDFSGIDVDMLNTFTYLGTAFIIGFFFFFVCKGVYRLFNMFF